MHFENEKRKKLISFLSTLALARSSKTGHKWRSHRKLIAPTFHLNVLKSFIDLFNENSRQVVKKLEMEIGKTFDAHDHMSEATVEILLGKFSPLFYITISISAPLASTSSTSHPIALCMPRH